MQELLLCKTIGGDLLFSFNIWFRPAISMKKIITKSKITNLQRRVKIRYAFTITKAEIFVMDIPQGNTLTATNE